jgi:hypothetical protein
MPGIYPNLPNLWKKPQRFSSALLDATGLAAADLNARGLIDQNGGATVRWDTADCVLLSGGIVTVDWQHGVLFDSGAVGVVNWESLQLVNEANHVVVAWDDARLIDPLGQPSVDWGIRGLMRSDTDVALGWATCQTYAIDTTISLDWNIRQLYDGDGTATVDWNARKLSDSDGIDVVNWQLQTLVDGTGAISADWFNRQLLRVGDFPVVDWANSELMHVSGEPSVNWEAGKLIATDGGYSADWHNRILFTPDGHEAINWGNYRLNDADGNTSVDWIDRVLINSSGVETANWESQKLSDTSGNVMFDWSDGTKLQLMSGQVSVSSYGNITDASMVGQTLYLTDFGVRADGRQVGDAATTAGTKIVTSATLNATDDDIGKSVLIYKAGTSGATFKSQITAVSSSTSVTVAVNVPTTTAGTLMVVATDDTTAVQNAVDAIVNLCRTTNHKSGNLIPPDSGIIYCGGPLQDTGFANSVITFPNIRKQDDGKPAITITLKPRGPWTDTQYWGFSQEPPHLTGPVFLFSATGSGTNPSCFGSTPDSWTTDAGPSPCGTVALNIDNVTIRQLDPSSLHALNWYTAGDLMVGTICCDTFCRITDSNAPVFGAGVRFPANGASATYIGHNIQVFRHDRGIEVANQSDIRHAFINFCRAAVAVHAFASNVGARFGYTLIQRCARLVEVLYDGGAGWKFALSWDWLQTENSDPADSMVWTRPDVTGQIADAGWALTGKINVIMNFTGGIPTRNGAVDLWMQNLLTNEVQGGGRNPIKYTNVSSGQSMTFVLNDVGGRQPGFTFQWNGTANYAIAVDERYGGSQPVVSEYNAFLGTYDRTYQLATRDWRFQIVDYTAAAGWAPWMGDSSFNGWCCGPYLWGGSQEWRLRLADVEWFAPIRKYTRLSVVSAAVTPDAWQSNDFYVSTGANLTLNSPTHAPADGWAQTIVVGVKNTSGGAITVSAAGGSSYRFGTDLTALGGVAAGKTRYYTFRWNPADSKWDFVAEIGGF